ncbi:MAG: hypothetical protein GX304_06170 [Clostridiales bacterium]|jgi:hypothetical protein|nr:hypothetical protein [Clostridiales bacterium]
MNNAFGTYVFSIAGAVVLTTIADLLMPEGKNSKHVKNALSIFLALIIISPLAKVASGEIKISDLFDGTAIEVDYSFISKLNERKVRSLEQSLERHLAEKGYPSIKVRILYTDNKEGINMDYAHIDLTSFEFNTGEPHIHIIDEIVGIASAYLKLPRERIYTYGAG